MQTVVAEQQLRLCGMVAQVCRAAVTNAGTASVSCHSHRGESRAVASSRGISFFFTDLLKRVGSPDIPQDFMGVFIFFFYSHIADVSPFVSFLVASDTFAPGPVFITGRQCEASLTYLPNLAPA